MRSTLAAIIATIMCALFSIAVVPAAASAAPPSNARYISGDGWGGYVQITDINLRGSTFSFTATIESTRGAIPVNPFYFVAKASDGTTYDDPDFSTTDLHSGYLSAGQRVKGTVAFTVNGPRPTAIQYEGVLGETLAMDLHLARGTKVEEARTAVRVCVLVAIDPSTEADPVTRTALRPLCR